MTDRVYLDWNATAPLRLEVRAAMLSAMDCIGNASSVHAEGRAARQIVEDAREQVASLVGAAPRNVVFTSGGTEANMLALAPGTGAAPNGPACGRLLVSGIEHPSVLAGGSFPLPVVERLAVQYCGRVDLADLRKRLVAPFDERRGRTLVSLMLANNETGIVQPVSEAAAIVHEAGGLLHVDAVQAAGRIQFDINALGADLLTVSGHKIGGPKGIGALVRRDDALAIHPLVTGGGQERGARAGTENVLGIAGFGAAAAAVREEFPTGREKMLMLRRRLEAGLRAASSAVVIFGDGVERLPNTTLFALPGMKAETAVIALDLEGVAVSSGAACSSGKVQPSHVLAAMGVDPLHARAAVRVSLGPTTCERDVNFFLGAWNKVARVLLKGLRDIAA